MYIHKKIVFKESCFLSIVYSGIFLLRTFKLKKLTSESDYKENTKPFGVSDGTVNYITFKDGICLGNLF